MKIKKIRSAYGKPFSKLLKDPRALVTPKLLRRLGEIMVEEVIREAKKQYARQGGGRTPRGQPEGLPGPAPFKADHPAGRHDMHVFPEFLDSFDYKLVGKSTVAITSSWLWIDQIIEGRSPFKMDWLTRDKVPRVPIVTQSGKVLVRMTPNKGDKLWVHPGFKKHNFVNRAVKKARKRAAEEIRKEIQEYLRQADPLS